MIKQNVAASSTNAPTVAGSALATLYGSFRKLKAGERDLLREHLLRLTPDDRCLRFCSVVGSEHIEHYCARSDERHRIIVGYFWGGVLRGAGEIVFFARPAWRGTCEVALSVEQPYQCCGVGAELLRRLLVIARNRGVANVRMLCVRDNRRMQRLARKFDANLRFVGSEVEGTLYPRWPSTASLLEESWHDGAAVLAFVFGLRHSAEPPVRKAHSEDVNRVT